ncbi:MAG TPA: YecA family protein [Rubrivivax sp.]|nr:YecA family protein [Rubrivivax sp.]
MPIAPPPISTDPLTEADMVRLENLLDALPPPLQPLDVSALDGFLCGVLLQPQRIESGRWMPHVTDLELRPVPATESIAELHTLVHRRHAELDRAIGQRQWFDPWIYQLDEQASPGETVLPWVAGFAAAMEAFPALMAIDAPELVEPLALLFMHFDPQDLEDAEALLAVIETLEPPQDLAEAVQDIVRALMLMADVTRPRTAPRSAVRKAPARRGAPGPRGRRR